MRPMIYENEKLILLDFNNLFLHGHAPGKNSINRVHLRKDAAKSGPQAGTLLG